MVHIIWDMICNADCFVCMQKSSPLADRSSVDNDFLVPDVDACVPQDEANPLDAKALFGKGFISDDLDVRLAF